MNETLSHLIKDRKLSPEQLKQHNIVYNPGRYCVSFPIKDEYGQHRGQLEYRPGQDLKYMYLLKQSTKPAIYLAHHLKRAFYGKPVFVTEAPIDALSLEKLGYLAVSTLSAKLNQQHMKILSRYTDKVIILFDNDTAGQNAAAKAIMNFGEQYGIFNCIIKGAKDPNELLQMDKEADLKSQLDTFIERIK